MGILDFFFYTRQRRVKFIESYPWPTGLRSKFALHHPQLSTWQQELVFQALRNYFLVCRMAGKNMVSMPSQVVDDAWHEFILFTRDYNAFCQHAFGRFLHHTPAEAMKTPTLAQNGIKRAWRLSCRLEKIDVLRPSRLPLLFAIDTQLKIPNGYRYDLNCLARENGTSNSYCATHIGCG